MAKYIAELIGTFALVFAGTSAIVVNDITKGGISHVGVALTFGFVVMAMIYAVGDVSGAHINPAVTVGFWLAGKLPFRDLFPYLISQITGAMIASIFIWFLFPEHPDIGATLPAGTATQSFVLEAILTFLLMFVILNISNGSKEKGMMAGIAVGGTVALEALFAGPISGASMNPARSLGPALVSGYIVGLWIYLTAPFAGVFLVTLGYKCIQTKGCC